MTDEVIQTNKLDIKKDSEDYRKLSREILKAHIDVLEVEKRRTLGDYGSPKEVVLTPDEVYHGRPHPFAEAA